jgi:ABC-2 type transport system ATP-binding protein
MEQSVENERPDSDAVKSGQVMIKVENLVKDYGPHRALDGISYEVRQGEVLGFLGPNGAGKTTTMKILTCFLAPTSGNAWVRGVSVAEDTLAVRSQIGYLPESTPLYGDMSVLEFLEFAASLRRVDSATRDKRIGHLAEVCGLDQVLAKSVSALSKGFRQRVGLAQALIHDPPVLILDEPTSGLDPNQIVEIRQLIKSIGREKTVILSTHILPEVQATCGRVVIINEGKLVADGTPDELSSSDGKQTCRIVLETENTSPAALREQLLAVRGITSAKEVPDTEPGATSWLLTADDSADPRRELFCCARDNDWVLLELHRQQASLEDVFRRLTR